MDKTENEVGRPAAKFAAGLFVQVAAWVAAGCIGWFAHAFWGAILVVEFAKERRARDGLAIVEAALSAARERFRLRECLRRLVR